MHTLRILVVDDDFQQRRLFCEFLTRQNFQANAVPSAVDAVSRIQSFRPDLVLIDIGMPGIGGIGLLRILRSSPHLSALPVILMSGLPVPTEMMQATAKGLGERRIFAKGEDLFILVDLINERMGSSNQFVAESGRHIRRGRLEADLNIRSVSYADTIIQMRARSIFDLLCALMRSPEPLSREALHQLLWAENDTSSVVPVAIKRLRAALASFTNIHIETTPKGYVLTVDK